MRNILTTEGNPCMWKFFFSCFWTFPSPVRTLVPSAYLWDSIWPSSVQFSHSVMSDSLWPHESQHARPPCPSPTPGVYSNSCPSSWWCHPTISSSVVLFSYCPQSLPASGSLPMSQLFAWGGQSIGVSASASVLPMNTQDWSPTSSNTSRLWRFFITSIQNWLFLVST